MRRALSAVGLFFLLLLATAPPALAQEGGSTAGETGMEWLFRWLNFAIVIGLVAYYVVKKGGPYFRRHADEIAAKIAEGARAREAAEQRRREMEAKLAGLEQEIAQMRAEAKRDAEAEAQRLRAMARAEADRIEQTAQAEIAAAERAGHLELKALAARLALERAEALLERELTAETDGDLFRIFVRELGGSAN
ncbi:MAG TPA: ATP synthase F0 subunit B [Candidatus Cybelea sp.]|nr:ATP synthase F0 subunit B [Candidatus Cybelea sp.]